MENNRLGEYIRTFRGTLSLRDFATKCGISHTHLDSIEKGFDVRTNKPVSPTIETINKIAKGAHINPSVLFNLAQYVEIDEFKRRQVFAINFRHELAFNGININEVVIELYNKLIKDGCRDYNSSQVYLELYGWINGINYPSESEIKLLGEVVQTVSPLDYPDPWYAYLENFDDLSLTTIQVVAEVNGISPYALSLVVERNLKLIRLQIQDTPVIQAKLKSIFEIQGKLDYERLKKQILNEINFNDVVQKILATSANKIATNESKSLNNENIILINRAAVYLDDVQIETMLAIFRAAFPAAFNQAEDEMNNSKE